MQNLHFTPSLTFFTVGCVALIVVGTLCVLATTRSARPKRTGAIEALRFLITLLVVLMLWGPEWKTIITPENEPEIAILWDASRSGETLDAQLPDGKNSVVSRRAFIDSALKLDVWKTLENNGKTAVFSQPFSEPSPNTETTATTLQGTDINDPIEKLLEQHDNLRAIVLLSDGDWNTGSPPIGAAQKMLLKNVPLFTIPVGSKERLPDIEILDITAPTYGIIGEPIQIPFSLRSSLKRDINTTIKLRDTSNGKEFTKKVHIPAGKEYFDNVLWRIDREGTSKLELSFPVAEGELVVENNRQEFIIQGKKENLKVLVIESIPRWEYRFIRNALSRDPGVDLDCLLFHPKLGKGDGPDYIQDFPDKLEDLQKYDVVFIGDVGIANGQLTLKQTELLKGLVENQASGIVFIPGSKGNQKTLLNTPLGELIPVILDESKPEGISESTASPLALTSQGRGSLLTMLGDNELENERVWKNLPGFYWSAAIEKAKGGADVLATHANRRNRYGRIPLLVTKSAGNGKVLYLGHDSAWRWRRGVEDLYHYRFWGQVARWMSYQRNMAAGEQIRLYYSPDRPRPADVVTLKANAFDSNGAPLTDGSIYVDVTSPNGEKSRIELTRSAEAWGSYSGRTRISLPGEWKLSAGIVNDADATVETTIIAQGDVLEKTGQPARPEVLEEMARVTGGEVIMAKDIKDIANRINALPIKKPQEESIPLWAQIASMITLIVLLALFWTLRKLNGTF
ncbi:hypothetical protein BSZ32_02870 [Rubritalea profundi]|uniref:Glutamine amidotransferase domain-containing protein n=1 Tax=Rubritalea profundi TaxID=1658618 RepID=A0A2S7U6Q4_9BACT|nr:hypothetical protein BSZ32_02870 [Rubritalea profundi]